MEKELPDEQEKGQHNMKSEVAQSGAISAEFPKGKENYCPQCYFEEDVVILRGECHHSK